MCEDVKCPKTHTGNGILWNEKIILNSTLKFHIV